MAWTRATLRRECFRRFSAPSLKVRRGKLRTSAAALYENPDGTLTVVVDPTRDGIMTCVVHELVHAVLYDDLRRMFSLRENPRLPYRSLLETTVEAIESAIFKDISRRDCEFERWRKVLDAKLKA